MLFRNALGSLNYHMMLCGNTLKLDELYEQAMAGTNEEAIRQLESKIIPIGESGYRIVYTLMVFVFLIGFSIAFLKLFLFADSRSRSENKSDLVWKIVIVVCAIIYVVYMTMKKDKDNKKKN